MVKLCEYIFPQCQVQYVEDVCLSLFGEMLSLTMKTKEYELISVVIMM